MEKVPPKLKKVKGATREDLLQLDKSELVDRILQLEAHNMQLKNIISKNLSNGSEDDLSKRKKPFDFSKCHYRRVLLHILYFGWDYQGLAVQEDTNQTIEHHLFKALIKSCLIRSRQESQYNRCGRTDKGVSAFGQVISITLRSKHTPETQYDADSISTELSYCKILNRLLPKEIRAVAWMPIPAELPEYSARFDCKKRQYKYFFPRSYLDITAMRTACSHLIGSHDFRHLCKMDVGGGVTEFVRNILSAEIVPVDRDFEKPCSHLIGSHDFRHLCKMDVGGGVTEFVRNILSAEIVPVDRDFEKPTSMYCLVIEGNAFLWHQIRCIMGVLLLIGQGHEAPDVIRQLLDVDTCQRKPQYNMALDVPLNLFHCSYELEENQKWEYDRDELRNVIVHLQSDWTIHSVKTTMIRESMEKLTEIYNELSNVNEGDSSEIMSHTECLIQGVKPRVYVPLMKRVTCSSLEERIDHYKKKGKVENTNGSEEIGNTEES